MSRMLRKVCGGCRKGTKARSGQILTDMTTLYFEASDGDDLRKTGFSKDGKHHRPQIMIGLPAGLGGYLPGYDIYEGNTYEGNTPIPFIMKTSERFSPGKPVVIADSGLLSDKNIAALEADGYEYIIGARIKNESQIIKNKILAENYDNERIVVFEKGNSRRLPVSFTENRARKDRYNREKGLKRLEKRIKTGKLTKDNINNRGYNKYLRLEGEINVSIDNQKFIDDAAWDGLNGAELRRTYVYFLPLIAFTKNLKRLYMIRNQHSHSSRQQK